MSNYRNNSPCPPGFSVGKRGIIPIIAGRFPNKRGDRTMGRPLAVGKSVINTPCPSGFSVGKRGIDRRFSGCDSVGKAPKCAACGAPASARQRPSCPRASLTRGNNGVSAIKGTLLAVGKSVINSPCPPGFSVGKRGIDHRFSGCDSK